MSAASVEPVAAAASTDHHVDITDHVDITRDNFNEMFPLVEHALKECSFFAFDCEMTGLFLNDNKDELLDDMQDRYSKLSASAQSFVINQFGISAFKQSDGSGSGAYTASTFNFYIFPEPSADGGTTQKFTSDAGALSFLAGQGFDFNKWIYKGVPYMTMKERNRRMKQINSSSELRNEITPSKQEDLDFMADLVNTVGAWMAGEEPKLMLPQVNSYQRLLAYQELAKPQFGVEGRPGFFVQKVYINNWTRLQLVRGSEEEVKAMDAEDKKQRLEALRDALGFTRVFDAIKRSGKPAVGHNCMFDICYTLAAFAEPTLPAKWGDFKNLAAEWFRGGLYDTKHLARMLPEVFEERGTGTSLGDVFRGLTQDGPQREHARSMVSELSSSLGIPVTLPSVQHGPGFGKYVKVEAGEAAHEAGYDAFMTGSIFASLMPLVHAKLAKSAMQQDSAPTAADADGRAAAADGVEAAAADSAGGDWDAQLYNPWDYTKQFVGRMNLGRSDMPYAALSGPDAPLVRPNVFHISGLQPGTRNGDVLKRFQAEDLGRVRVTFLNASSAYVEVEPSMAPRVLTKMNDDGGGSSGGDGVRVVSYEAHVAERQATAAASDAERRNAVGGSKPGSDVYGRAPKRLRAEEEELVAAAAAPERFRCAIM